MRPLIRLAALVLIVCINVAPGFSQEFFRFKADFSIKEKNDNQTQGSLITGQVYYDKNLGKITYDIRFPAPERWLLVDTLLYRIVADTLAGRRSMAPLGEYSFFSLILHQHLTDYGLTKAGYTSGAVTMEGRELQSTWHPPAALAGTTGPVIIAQENNRLTGLIFLDDTGNVLSKFYLQDYQLIDGLAVPGKIYQVYYREKSEFVRVMNFKNVVINHGEEEMYDFALPARE